MLSKNKQKKEESYRSKQVHVETQKKNSKKKQSISFS